MVFWGPRESFLPKLHLDRFNRFCSARPTVVTDTQTTYGSSRYPQFHTNSPLLALRAAICGRKVELFHRRDLPSPHRELKCADTIGTVRAGFLGWPFPVLKY